MPSSSERRLINWFANSIYNTQNVPKIIGVHAEKEQEAPDSICTLEDGRMIALELTSFGPPKGARGRHIPHYCSDLSPLMRTLDRKLNNDYKVPGADEVWLLTHLRYTLPRELVEQALEGFLISSRFDRIYIEWPLPEKTDRTSVNVLELPSNKFWIPDIPRPKRNKKIKIPEYLLR